MSARTPLLSDEQNPRAAHGCGHVDLLHQLPPGIMTKAREVTGGIFFGVANVEAIERAVTLRLERGQLPRPDCRTPAR